MNHYRILIVEDEAIVAMDIEDRLAAMGYEPIGRASSGEHALALTEEHRPNLVLMDIRLQGAMDGITAASEIRQRFHVPVIILTAYSEDATLARAKLAEPYGYLLKPFDDRELKSAIEIALYKHEAEEEIRRLNRFYDVLSQVNQAIVRIESREELLQAVCRLVVERGGFDMAWIGRLDRDTSDIVKEAQFGDENEISILADFHSGSGPAGEGNPGRAIREGRTFVCNECGEAACLYPFVNAPVRFGFRSCGSFPLRFQGRVWGALTLCAADAESFREREIELLQEVAMDISFALEKMDGDAQRKRLSEQFQRQSMFLGTLLDAMPYPVFFKDTNLRYLGCNAAFEQLTGIGRAEIVGQTVYDIWPPELAGLCHGADLELLTGGGRHQCETTLRTPDGVRRQILYHKACFRNPDGRLGGIIGVMEDTTERKRAEEALRHSEENLKRAQAVSRIGSWHLDFPNEELECSDETYRILNLPVGSSPGVDGLLACVPPEDQQPIRAAWKAALVGAPFDLEHRIVSNGTEKWVRVRAEVQFAPDGSPLACLGTLQDITENKRLEDERTQVEAQLRQAQKMEALGTLAGGIAHDFNNILGIIAGYTEIALLEMEEESPVRSRLKEVLGASHRAKDLVQQIVAFSRRKEMEKKPLQVGLIVKEAMKMLRASLPSTIEIKTCVESKSVVAADPTQIHQVLMNLCTNAAHAMQDRGGVLDVGLTDVLLDAESVRAHAGLQTGMHVKLTVRDTGPGIAPAILERIFDPFFTTKEPGVGTGLGLAVVHGIVKSHEGAIEVENQPGEGATFHVFLPVMSGIRTMETVVETALPRGKERILVVDDEPALAMVVKQMLERLGYTVEYRTSGSEALHMFRLDPSKTPFDLVITDMTMPHLTGLDLARELLKLHPDFPIILCTGFSEKMDAEKAKGLGIQGFLMKPVILNELAGMIRKTLNETVH